MSSLYTVSEDMCKYQFWNARNTFIWKHQTTFLWKNSYPTLCLQLIKQRKWLTLMATSRNSHLFAEILAVSFVRNQWLGKVKQQLNTAVVTAVSFYEPWLMPFYKSVFHDMLCGYKPYFGYWGRPSDVLDCSVFLAYLVYWYQLNDWVNVKVDQFWYWSNFKANIDIKFSANMTVNFLSYLTSINSLSESFSCIHSVVTFVTTLQQFCLFLLEFSPNLLRCILVEQYSNYF